MRAFQKACEFGADSSGKLFLAREDFKPSAYVTFLGKLPRQKHPFLPLFGSFSTVYLKLSNRTVITGSAKTEGSVPKWAKT